MSEINKVNSGLPPLANTHAEEKAVEQQKQQASPATASPTTNNEDSLLLTELVQSVHGEDSEFTAERAEKIAALQALYQKGDYEINILQTAEGILKDQL
ncbi:hypothetical protein Psal006b_03503 (plasmid) [Piscirickettsia salmonis]|uniref:Flagellar protein FlgM n=1 Tax=Piscirickettsia salmonis TaxID=1238 RepID=A0A6I5Y1M7_PISSA|nr:hypothetical protein [Piscirickettsia salmonis]AKP74210.1 hypothetical protein PSLF89_2560 [Piscirickettsia salmonis LF-89 = ATCC VR-1361]ALB23102.1 flagellar protein FlgM [Piscirickettsia salmonis]ALY03037.1 hypothetical protein AWE47_09430 [Piscirickettsia salmonis]AMA42595.1 hypothetical protein AWJ11_09635 [Piscirickettsia salmonis]AOS35065.1 hypothetical protein AVM72_06775 [Piscirickettsia salmonis]